MPTRKYDDYLIQLARGLDLSSTDGLQSEVNKLIQSTCEFMAVDRASVWLYGDQNQLIECKSLYTQKDNNFERGMILKKEDFSPYFEALENERLIEAKDANTHPATSCFSKEYLDPLGIQSMYDTPVWNADKVIGVLCLEYLKPKDDWAPEEKYFITSVADLLAKLYDKYEVLKLVESLEEKVAQRTEELSETLDNLRNTQQILIESEKLASLGTVISGVAHEIRNPLNHISTAAEIINETVNDFSGETIEEVKDVLAQTSEIMMKEVSRADNVIREMVDQSSTRERRSMVDLNSLLEKAVNLSVHHIDNENKVFPTLKLGEIEKVFVSKQKFLRVFINLLENSIKAVEVKRAEIPDFRPLITVSTEKVDQQIVIIIRDNGIGISETVMKNIFQPFYTTRLAGTGTGLGLSIVYDIIKLYSGSIELDSIEGEFTEVKLSIPILRKET